MVPSCVMPEGIQTIGACSPLAWGLEGYLDLFVRKGGIAGSLPQAARLLGFFAATVLSAWACFKRRIR